MQGVPIYSRNLLNYSHLEKHKWILSRVPDKEAGSQRPWFKERPWRRLVFSLPPCVGVYRNKCIILIRAWLSYILVFCFLPRVSGWVVHIIQNFLLKNYLWHFIQHWAQSEHKSLALLFFFALFSLPLLRRPQYLRLPRATRVSVSPNSPSIKIVYSS